MVLLAPMTTYAHVMGSEGFDEVLGFRVGFKHPVLGLDHLLAMVSVGIVSAQIGGRAIWTVPATFVLVMALSGFVGMGGYAPYLTENGLLEIGISFSVFALGLAIAASGYLNLIVVMLFVATFATFHGYAHGVASPDLSSSWTYVAGFMTGTATLHLIGVFIGHFSNQIKKGATLLRYGGAMISGMGLHLLLQMFGF